MLWPTELSSLVLRLRSGSFNSQMVYHERAKRVEWWVREDLNLHALRHSHLKAACIPISPLTRKTKPWWRLSDSNRGHKALQASALPTELKRRGAGNETLTRDLFLG